MRNDRDDKYEGSDDSEYHFSGDDSQYESESESDSTQKAAPAESVPAGVIETTRSSRRMVISLFVFVALIAVVYKMVAPSSSAPGTDIKPVTQVADSQTMNSTAPTAAQPAQATPAPDQAAAQTVATVQQPQQPPAPNAMQAQAAPAQPMQAAQTVQQSPQAMQPAMAGQDQTIQSIQQPQQPPQVMSAAPDPQQAMAVQQQGMQQPAPQSVQPAPQQTMPGVMSAMQPPASQPAPVNQATDMSFAATLPTAGNTPGVDSQAAALAAENARLYSQLQAEYAKRLNDFQNDNKNLQSQVQVLNTRVATMETEMTQLIQTLTQQFQGNAAPQGPTTAPVAAMPETSPPPRIPYNVQAIIPGRAWLKSNNGDTLTVAEGDEIKGIGRVTKIDPYDGVVEINVHGKIVSLSYGNGG